MRSVGSSTMNVGFASAYHSLAGANALRASVSRRLTNPYANARIAYNAKARQQMMDDIERRQLMWEGEQLTRQREDTRYDAFGNRLRDARRRGRLSRMQQQRAGQGNRGGGGGRPSRVNRPSPTGRSTNSRNSGNSGGS